MEMHFYNDNLKARDKRCSHSPRDCHVRFFARHTIVAAFRCVTAVDSIHNCAFVPMPSR